MATGTIEGFPIIMESHVWDNISISANTGSTQSADLSKPGYMIMGCAGYEVSNASSDGSGNAYVVTQSAFIRANGTAYFKVRNVSSSSAKVKLTLYVLYYAL